MLFIPAIDLLDGKVVRLYKGEKKSANFQNYIGNSQHDFIMINKVKIFSQWTPKHSDQINLRDIPCFNWSFDKQ